MTMIVYSVLKSRVHNIYGESGEIKEFTKRKRGKFKPSNTKYGHKMSLFTALPSVHGSETDPLNKTVPLFFKFM